MKNFNLLYFIIFILALITGYLISTQFTFQDLDSNSSTLQILTAHAQNPIKTMDNGQRSILLVGTSAIQAQDAHLESIWMLTYLPSDTIIRLLPIFPSGKQAISDFDNRLDQSFQLVNGKGTFTLGQEFIAALESKNYWWSGYIVFDDMALGKMIDLVGGIEFMGKTLSGEQVLQALPEVVNDPFDAYYSQMSILRSTCWKVSQYYQRRDPAQLGSLIPKHVLTDLNLDQLQGEWQSLYTEQQAPVCSFPMLDMSFSIR
jgi:hypothetical protein